MNIQRFLRYGTVIALVMVLAVALSGCLRAASEGITDTTDTTGSSYPVPGATDQNMGELGTLVAQTEAAQQTPGMPPATQQPVVNPEVPAVTETPQPVPPEQQPQPTAAPVVYIEATAGAPPPAERRANQTTTTIAMLSHAEIQNRSIEDIRYAWFSSVRTIIA